MGIMNRAEVANLSLEQFTAHARILMERACPTTADEPLFNRFMREAACLGLTYVEALGYVIDRRKQTLN